MFSHKINQDNTPNVNDALKYIPPIGIVSLDKRKPINLFRLHGVYGDGVFNGETENDILLMHVNICRSNYQSDQYLNLIDDIYYCF